VRKAVKWLAGAVGLAALARLRSRRRVPAGGPLSEDPAEELRRRLADRRDAEAPGVETDVDAGDDDTGEAETGADPVEIDRRRAEVHARAQEAIESMREGELPPDGPGTDTVA
jgi:hypothetical protein